MIEPLPHVRLPVSCQRPTGRILSPAVGISYRLNGRVAKKLSLPPAEEPNMERLKSNPAKYDIDILGPLPEG
jgi:hypothetical protein